MNEQINVALSCFNVTAKIRVRQFERQALSFQYSVPVARCSTFTILPVIIVVTLEHKLHCG